MRKVLRALSIIAALSGCSEIEHERAQPPIVINPNNRQTSYILKTYDGIAEEDLEKRLVELARTSDTEEGWYYNRRTKQVVEIGINESRIRLQFIIPEAIEDDLVFYHIHPFKGYAELMVVFEGGKAVQSSAEKFQARVGKPSPLAIHGINDFMAYTNILIMHPRNFEFKMADSWGISTVRFDRTRIPKLGSHELDVLVNSVMVLTTGYYLGSIDAQTYTARSKELGVDVSYKVLDSSPILVGVRPSGHPVIPYKLDFNKAAGTPPVDK